jgi:ABC-2 type transport system permease protein
MNPSLGLTWFARHELMLAWRDWAQMMAGGRTTRERAVAAGALIFVLLLHGLAYVVVAPLVARGTLADKETLVMLTASLLLTFSMMLSQAIEQVTRAFYARADLDLILSSPAPARNLFAVRVAAIALTGALMASLLISPFINMAAALDGVHWLAAYVVILAMSGVATALSVIAAVFMFRTIGPKRTRLVAQILAAVVGAALLIGIQAVAVMTYGNLSRVQVLRSETVLNAAPDADSIVWLPARALLGDGGAALALVLASGLFLALILYAYCGRFSDHAIAAAGVADSHATALNGKRAFRSRSSMQALRAKEWSLLARDPWLMSQTLMQVLYLIPPALLLWRDMGADTQVHAILAPVLVMAFGQLSGGLAWLAISGEDAPDLVATAPVTEAAVRRAKNEAVLAVIGIGSLPFVLGLAAISPWGAAVSAIGIIAASASAIIIQLWFRVTARRAQFRRRQTASRAATFAEAFSSIAWAGAAGFAAAQSWFAIIFVVSALIVLAITRAIRPQE